MGLRTVLHSQRGLIVAQVVGDVDILTAHRLRTDLSRGLSLSTRGLVIDLARVGFMDDAGLGVLVGIDRAATSQGKYLTLFSPRPWLRGMLRTNGLYGHFTIEPQNADDVVPAATPTDRLGRNRRSRTRLLPVCRRIRFHDLMRAASGDIRAMAGRTRHVLGADQGEPRAAVSGVG